MHGYDEYAFFLYPTYRCMYNLTSNLNLTFDLKKQYLLEKNPTILKVFEIFEKGQSTVLKKNCPL